MKRLLIALGLIFLASCAAPKKCCAQQPKFGQAPIPKENKFAKNVKKFFKYSTFYGAVSGGNSISDVDIYSVSNGLTTEKITTPFDYSAAFGVRKIARFGYENKANQFYNGTEQSYGDAATIGKVNGFEFLFEADWTRQQGKSFFNQHHFLRYVANRWIAKAEYLQNGVADIEYFESSQRYRQKFGNKFSLNGGCVQRLSPAYGYDPLEPLLLDNGNIHYTNLAIQEGYTMNFSPDGIEYLDPSGNVVATSNEVWEAVVVPQMLSNYVDKETAKIEQQWDLSFVIGFDFYHYTKDFWLHAWGNVLPFHIDLGSEYSYLAFNEKQYIDYGGGLIFGYYIIPQKLGMFAEGTYNKYWNRQWHAFSIGLNYTIR